VKIARRSVTAGALASLLLVTTAAAEDSAARQTVARLNAGLLDVLKQAQALGYEGRFRRLAPVVGDAFDVDFMAEKSLGSHWKALDEADRTRWREVFREYTIANYAGNFDRYSCQRFELLGDEPGANETTVVHTKLVDPGGEDVELNYRLHEADGRWSIVDVYLKGTVSELALRRSDYTAVLAREGFDGLVSSLRDKITDLAAGRAKRRA
jgi:phospholipid transport system substrate-binding protein